MSQTRPSLVALGDLLLDVVVRPDRPIERGTDVPGSIEFRRGGSAANTTAAFAGLGGSATLITSLGDDAWAPRLAASLRTAGVRVRAARHAGASGRLVAIIDERGERSFVTQRGAADALDPADLDPAWLRGADALHLPAYSLFGQPIGSAAAEAARLVRDAGVLLSLDLSSRGPLQAFGVRKARARIRDLGLDLLFATRDEASALLARGGRRSWVELLTLAPLVVVKDGVWGCRVLRQEGGLTRQVDVAATRIGRRVDTTGAGDAFSAGFLHALIRAGGRSVVARDPVLRRAALAGHRAAAAALQLERPELRLG